MKTHLLQQLYQQYHIADLTFGSIHDKLGDVYEDYCVSLLENKQLLAKLKINNRPTDLDSNVFCQLLYVNGITNFHSISSIQATTQVPHRSTGGLPKTDIIATVNYVDRSPSIFCISCKQSTVAKVALAEFDVDTICKEMGINNPRLHELLLKHQVDCSAKNFSSNEKTELNTLMKPIARDFVRWVLTGSPKRNPSEVCYPTSLIKFELTPPKDRYNICISDGDFDLVTFNTYTIEDYIDSIMYNRNGTIKSGGFGTGLSWTYATGSKGIKMQFKG